VLVLRTLEGMSQSEVASLLGISERRSKPACTAPEKIGGF
jgi:DNA-directed RNA polymerase specialized sigma24 family protein